MTPDVGQPEGEVGEGLPDADASGSASQNVGFEDVRRSGSTLSRRGFLQAGALATAGGAVGAMGSVLGVTPAGATAEAPFHGIHQSSILSLPSRAALFISFDVVAADRSGMVELLHAITDRSRILVAGGAPPFAGPAAPTSDNGILGPVVPPRQLSLAIGVGSSLFDERFGFGGAKPAVLKPMGSFPDDNLDPAQCQGDISVGLFAADADTVIHGLRDITKYTRGAMQPRWRIDGFVSPPRPTGVPRNLLGFNDGIANPNVDSIPAMDELVWVRRGPPEPAWTYGGSYQVIRIIRMLVEFWDRVSLDEQQLMIGRSRDTGAPLDGNRQTDIPDYGDDPEGAIIPTTAHIRVANPRTPQTAASRILRRGFNYDRGVDVNGNLDQGLIFTCYQQDLTRQFETVQTRLAGEPLTDYISPIGGGYFFILPGVADPTDYFGRSLVEATVS
jgi:deferrochelatase/peroxidase EfeB